MIVFKISKKSQNDFIKISQQVKEILVKEFILSRAAAI